jgi:hypothetical protein
MAAFFILELLMNQDQLIILANEIKTDPIGIGYTHLLTTPLGPGHVAEAMNAPTQLMLQAIESDVIMLWSASGPYANIVDAANNSAHPCRASCLVIKDKMQSGQYVHIEIQGIQDIFTSWVAAGVITQAQHDALMSLAMQPASRCQVLNIPPVNCDDLLKAGIVQLD